MGLVATWLSGIGLSYALPSFTAAGIVTPSALAELDAIYFEALGVKSPEDRRKLFFLVQRIKMAVERKDESVEEEVDAVLASTMRSTSLILDIDDSLDELLNDLQEEDGAVSVVPSPVSKARTVADTTNRSKENQKPKVAKIQSPQRARASAPISSSASAATVTTPPQARQVTMRRHKDDVAEEETGAQHRSPEFDNENGGELFLDAAEDDDAVEDILNIAEDDSDWDEDSGVSADDEMSSQPDVTSRRTSRRIHERRQRATSDSFLAAPAAAAAPANTSLSSSSSTSTRRTTSLSRPSTGRQSSDSSSHSPKRRSDGVTNLYSRDTESSMSDNSSSKPPARRLSGVPKPKSRRATDSRTSIQSNNPSKSMRTGKQLSSIPAERTLPMSPLVELPSSRMTADIEAQELGFSKATKRAPSSRRRSTSLDRFSEQGSDSSDVPSSAARGGSNSDTEPSRRRSDSESDGRGGSRRKSGRQSFGGVHSFGSETSLPRVSDSVPTPSRQSTGGTGYSRSLSASSRSNSDKRLSSSGSVMIQGKRDDDSFKYQIAQLQADNEEEHLLFNTPATPDNDEDDDMRIRVVIRKRPMSKAEITAAGDVDVIHPLDYGSYGRILAYHPKTRVDLTKEIETVPFAFDNVFDDKSTNVQIYERTVRHLIPGLFEGQWASIFAYGQTGSGKTFTMMGSNLTGIRDGSSTVHPSNLGLYYMAALDLFQAIQTPGFEHFTIGVSLFEIYGGKLFDLLNDRKHIKCLEDSKGKVCFPGLSEHGLSNPDDLISLIEQGAANRSTGTTSRNADSSRSHAVLQLHLRKRGGKHSDKEHSRLTFIDLAGSERGADTSSSSRATRLEGAEINTSLLALKEVIRALATGDSLAHVPFRGSKLTQVLKESFVGENCRSVMIACISPNIGNCEQTLNTLRYADRVKERNAETGEPTTSAQESRMRRSGNRKSPLALSSLLDLSCAGASGVSNRRSPNNSFESNNSSLLDDLLSPSPMKEIEEVHTDSRSDARNKAEELISAHKSAMSTMLGMVKNEMTLVNKADADRESLDDYITNLNMFHEKQVSLFINLREHILSYRNARKATQTQDLSDEDSIEDLRE